MTTPTPRPIANDGLDALKVALDHAWLWFDLHAGQRMQLVNYFFVAAAFITAGYGTALPGQRVVAGFIAVGGAIVALAFWRLEVRTRELVRISEAALKELEARLAAITGLESLGFITAIERPTARLSSYGTVIRALTLAATMLFGAGAAYAFYKG